MSNTLSAVFWQLIQQHRGEEIERETEALLTYYAQTGAANPPNLSSPDRNGNKRSPKTVIANHRICPAIFLSVCLSVFGVVNLVKGPD